VPRIQHPVWSRWCGHGGLREDLEYRDGGEAGVVDDSELPLRLGVVDTKLVTARADEQWLQACGHVLDAGTEVADQVVDVVSIFVLAPAKEG
jgi:hypothetical protein